MWEKLKMQLKRESVNMNLFDMFGCDINVGIII